MECTYCGKVLYSNEDANEHAGDCLIMNNSDCSIKIPKTTPEKLERFMYFLIKNASRDSFVNFCKEVCGIDYDTEFYEIEDWFAQFGVSL